MAFEDRGGTIVEMDFEAPPALSDLCITTPEAPATRELQLAQNQLKIRLADTEARHESANLLLDKMYSWRGYMTSSRFDGVPNRVTLVAALLNQVIGTLTLCFDSQIGLPADEIFKDKLDTLRNNDCRLAEPSRFAVDHTINSRRVLAALFHIAYIHAKGIFGLTDFIIEVNPRHVGFYQKMLGFVLFCEERICPRVNAPAVLLRLNLDWVADQITKLGGKQSAAKDQKTLYPYFFSPADEAGITNRLLREVGA